MHLYLIIFSLLRLLYQVAALLDNDDLFRSNLEPCPAVCAAGNGPRNWTVYHKTSQIALCDQPVLLDFTIHNQIDDPNSDVTIRACTMGNLGSRTQTASHHPNIPEHRNVSSCTVASKHTAAAQLARWGTEDSHRSNDVVLAIEQLRLFLKNEAQCDQRIIFASFSKSLIGVYTGSGIDGPKTASMFAQPLADHIRKNGIGTRVAMEVCGEGHNAAHTLGIVADPESDFAAVQRIMASWSKAVCISDADHREVLNSTTIWTVDAAPSMTTQDLARRARSLQIRADCRTTKVVSGDSCGSLATRCGISGSDLTKYNKKAQFCGTLTPGQAVCCSAGTLPDIRPKPGADGVCAKYNVRANDNCQSIANKNGLVLDDLAKMNEQTGGWTGCKNLQVGMTICVSKGKPPIPAPVPGADGTCAKYNIKANDNCLLIANKNGLALDDLAKMNGQTWGWTGCENLQVGMNICLSKGKPPMPAPVPNAVCGPTVSGTKAPNGNTKLADLNPCPLKTCCNIWGQCGTTKDFCTISKSATGNPGTSAPKTSGCISNCGMDVVNNKEKPASFAKIAYFEGWNMERRCLNMDVRRIDKSYTHVHFSFAEVTPDFHVSIGSNITEQFDAFKKLSGPKRVLAFGGWTFSTAYDTAPIFRDSVTAANRALFASRVVKFAIDNKLDGLDFDWEYPGAKDIPGSPPGSKNDGKNYLEFLKVVREKMPEGMTLSIAAPASFWYLKGFPIEEMAPILDYIIYMTYDLHGQWDYGSQWANPGCPSGNCLRSHVNYTETYNSLAMITKAGVPAKKIIVGVSSYGRSFKMADRNCRGPTCKFLGTAAESPARKGDCTATSGYISNAEISEIINTNDNKKRWTDETRTNYLVYDDVEWVAYMDDAMKADRISTYQGLKFGGTSDWAVDLQAFVPQGGDPEAPSIDEDDYPLEPCDDSYESLDDIAENAAKIPPHCAPKYVLVVLKRLLEASLKTYNDIMNDGYDKKFDLYAKTVAGMGPTALRKYLLDHGNDYYSCEIVEEVTCCRGCKYEHGENSPQCQHCSLPLCEQATPWGTPSEYRNVSEPCPPDMSKRGVGEDGAQTIYWTLRPDKEDQWWEDVQEELGMKKDNIEFVPRSSAPIFADPERCALMEVRKESCDYRYQWFNAPGAPNYDKDDVDNPKDDITQSLDKIKNLGPDIEIVLLEIEALLYRDSPENLVDALALPILMIGQAVKAMQEVIETAESIEEAQKKEFILLFLSAILFIVPAIGSAVGSTVGRVLALLGEVGQAALDIYDVASNPDSAPLVVFSLILGAAGIHDAAKIGQAAKVRRDMSPEAVGKLGGEIKDGLDKVGTVIKPNMCSR